MMQYITSEQIDSLHISPELCVDWVREAFLMKKRAQLPAKISLHPQGNDFFNTMPCLLPNEYHTFGCKVVTRVKGTYPALKSHMMMFDTLTGDFTALINAERITAMRTGAVAALAINTLQAENAEVYSFLGLGVMAHATLRCFIATNVNRQLHIRLLRYKDQADTTARMLKDYSNVTVEIVNDMDSLIADADVIVSCITDADGLLVDNPAKLKPGVLLVPVHTRGFQNCDIIFDRIFADDTDHVRSFKFFNEFPYFAELSQVLDGSDPGRQSSEERIISYNIGLGLHDVLFAHKILNLFKSFKSKLL